MGKFGEVTVGRIGCFKSDTIFLPSISYIALDRKREIYAGRGGGVTRGHNATFRRVLHARVDQQRADGSSLYDDEVSFPRVFSYMSVRIVNRTLPSFLYYQFFMHN